MDGKAGREEEGEGRGGGRWREMAPLTQIPGSAPVQDRAIVTMENENE